MGWNKMKQVIGATVLSACMLTSVSVYAGDSSLAVDERWEQVFHNVMNDLEVNGVDYWTMNSEELKSYLAGVGMEDTNGMMSYKLSDDWSKIFVKVAQESAGWRQIVLRGSYSRGYNNESDEVLRTLLPTPCDIVMFDNAVVTFQKLGIDTEMLDWVGNTGEVSWESYAEEGIMFNVKFKVDEYGINLKINETGKENPSGGYSWEAVEFSFVNGDGGVLGEMFREMEGRTELTPEEKASYLNDIWITKLVD